MTAGDHRLAGTFTTKDGQLRFDVTKKKAYQPDAPEGLLRILAGPEGSDRDITLHFDHDQFDEERARVSWLRSAYLTLFAVTGFRAILAPRYEIARAQIREPKVVHILTFLIDTGGTEDWSYRAFVRFKEPAWQRCWGIAVGYYAVWPPTARRYRPLRAA